MIQGHTNAQISTPLNSSKMADCSETQFYLGNGDESSVHLTGFVVRVT